MTDPTPINAAWAAGPAAVTMAVHRSGMGGSTVDGTGSAAVGSADPASGEPDRVGSCWRAWVERRKPRTARQVRRRAGRGEPWGVRCSPVEVLYRPGEVAAWMDRQIQELAAPRTVTVQGRARVAVFDPQARGRLWHAHQVLAEQGHTLRTAVPGLDARYEVVAEPMPDGLADPGG